MARRELTIRCGSIDVNTRNYDDRVTASLPNAIIEVDAVRSYVTELATSICNESGAKDRKMGTYFFKTDIDMNLLYNHEFRHRDIVRARHERGYALNYGKWSQQGVLPKLWEIIYENNIGTVYYFSDDADSASRQLVKILGRFIKNLTIVDITCRLPVIEDPKHFDDLCHIHASPRMRKYDTENDLQKKLEQYTRYCPTNVLTKFAEIDDFEEWPSKDSPIAEGTGDVFSPQNEKEDISEHGCSFTDNEEKNVISATRSFFPPSEEEWPKVIVSVDQAVGDKINETVNEKLNDISERSDPPQLMLQETQ